MNFSYGKQKQTACCHFRDNYKKIQDNDFMKKIKWLKAIFSQSLRKHPCVTTEINTL